MAKREVEQHRSSREVPPVSRPKGAAWRALQADGVVWEGQVSLVGDDLDLAARMIVTHRRVVFVRGGDVTLDIPREWLRPEPVLRRDGVLDLFVTMPGSNLFDEPMPVPIRMREGHPAAGHIIAMLAPGGVRRILPESLSGMERAREAAPAPEFKGFWDVDGDEPDPSWEPGGPASAQAEASGRNGALRPLGSSDWLPVEPPDRVLRAPSAPERRPQTSGYAITGLQPKGQRKSPWGLLLRAVGLLLLLATAATLGAGRLNLGGSGGGPEAILTGPPPTAAVVASPSPPPEAALAPEDETAIAIGVGGAATQPEAGDQAPDSNTVQAATPPPSSTAATRPAASIPTPAPTAAALATDTTTAATARPSASELEISTAADQSPSPTAQVVTPAQSAAVDAGSVPAQDLAASPLRVTVNSAQRAESLPRYGLPPGPGEWVLLLVTVHNDGEAPAAIAMSDFRLFDREPGTTIELDSGTEVIAGLAGFDPPRAAADEVVVASGESSEALLLYLLPPGSSDDVALLIDDMAVDLAPVLAAGNTTAAT